MALIPLVRASIASAVQRGYKPHHWVCGELFWNAWLNEALVVTSIVKRQLVPGEEITFASSAPTMAGLPVEVVLNEGSPDDPHIYASLCIYASLWDENGRAIDQIRIDVSLGE